MRIIALILLVFFAGDSAQAAITKLLKKRKVAVIDDGDVSKGDKVCFYSASGRKRACGKVVKVKEDKSYVKVKSKKRFRRLKKGMAHEVNPSSSGGGSKMSGGHSFVLRLLYTPSFMGRSKFEYVDSNKEKGGEDGHFVSLGNSTIKENDSSGSKAARMFPWGSGGLEGEIFITPTMSLTMGGRYTHLNLSPRVIHNFLEVGDPEHLLTRYKQGYELGFWLDFFPLHVADLGLKLGLGGEFTMSNISFESDKMIDEKSGSTIIKKIDKPLVLKGKSSANIVSVRLSARKDIPMGDYGVGLGITGVISPAAVSSAVTIDGEPHETILAPYSGGGNKKEKMIEDLEAALDHTNNMLSVVFSLSVYFGI